MYCDLKKKFILLLNFKETGSVVFCCLKKKIQKKYKIKLNYVDVYQNIYNKKTLYAYKYPELNFKCLIKNIQSKKSSSDEMKMMFLNSFNCAHINNINF